MNLFNKIKSAFSEKSEIAFDLNSETILNFYWNKFIDSVSQHYPISLELLNNYSEAFNWNFLSKNENIEWNNEFLGNNKEKFNWTSITRNKSIIWDFDRIQKFKKHLDIEGIGTNSSTILDERLLEKYAKKMVIINSHPMLTEEIISKYNLKIFHSKEPKLYSEKNLENLFLYGDDFYPNVDIDVYNKYIEPIFIKDKLDEILKDKFDTFQKYYTLSPIINDEIGLTPEFIIENNTLIKGSFEEKGLIEINEKLIIKNGNLQEGKDRLYDLLRLSSHSFRTLLLISENVKLILESFKLPPHQFIKTNFQPKNIKTKTEFWILMLDYDQLMTDLDYSQNFYEIVKIDNTTKIYKSERKITSFEDYLKYIKNKKQKNSSENTSYLLTVLPESFLVNSDFDLYSYSVHGKIIVNELLKNELEEKLPNQMKFKRFHTPEIKINEEKYKLKLQKTIPEITINPLIYNVSKELKFYLSKKKRLLKEKKSLDLKMLEKDVFYDIQKKLNIILPSNFKTDYQNKNSSKDDYKYLGIESFYIHNEISDRFPETYNSLIFAENKSGDKLGLLLEKDSDYNLQNKLVEFFHESGDYEV